MVGGTGLLHYVSVAADAVDPQTVYIAFSYPSGSGLPNSTAGGSVGAGLGFLVSHDKGVTFAFATLATADSFDAWPDIISPAGGTVVVLNGFQDEFHREFQYWKDTTSGGALLDGGLTFPGDCPEAADGGTLAPCCTPGEDPGACQVGTSSVYALPTVYGDFPGVGQGGRNGAFEFPQLGTDGNGAPCVAHPAYPPEGSESFSEPVVQCSHDLGTTWAPQIHFAAAPVPGLAVSLPVGAITAATPPVAGEYVLALSWTENDAQDGGTTNATIHVATVRTNPTLAGSTVTTIASHYTGDGTLNLPLSGTPSVNGSGAAAVFYDSSGVLWLTYGVGSTVSTLVVDRSCDNGLTWHGPEYVPTAAPGDNAALPAFVPLPGSMGISARSGATRR